MDDRCDRCGGKIDENTRGTYMAGIHIATYGNTEQDWDTGKTVIPAGTFVHGDTWEQLCGECYQKWQEWFSLFMDIQSEVD